MIRQKIFVFIVKSRRNSICPAIRRKEDY
ncbi:Rdt1p [Saccharomyces cerevisiae S288C]|uniref:Uncharacterized protein RDT1 n=1 Tax=Saccharomyces cerevisiae (strain ATCC 204508 / S288c) TaxID=559292 RepID=RDT1_YEAST|eukprot:NP_001291943.1 Rdt1p [Saccharomyces cerevisiae S288C]